MLTARNPFAPASSRRSPYVAPAVPGLTNSQRTIPNTTITFRVSQVGADKTMLLRIFDEIKAQEERKRTTRGINFHVLQRLSPTEFLGYLASDRYSVDRSQLFILQTKTPRNAADGEMISNVKIESLDTVQSYTSVLGAQRSVRVLVEQDPKAVGEYVFTQEEFLERLRNHETWTLKNFETEDCRVCFGKGEMTAFQGGGPCWECTRSGEVGKAYVDYVVRW